MNSDGRSVSSEPTPGNIQDRQNYRPGLPEGILAKVMLDAIGQRPARETFAGMPRARRRSSSPTIDPSYFTMSSAAPSARPPASAERLLAGRNLAQALQCSTRRTSREDRRPPGAVGRCSTPRQTTRIDHRGSLPRRARRGLVLRIETIQKYLAARTTAGGVRGLVWAMTQHQRIPVQSLTRSLPEEGAVAMLESRPDIELRRRSRRAS